MCDKDHTTEQFFMAIMADNIDLASELLNESDFDPGSRFRGRFGLLHIAVWNRRDEIAKLLISAGADVNSREDLTGKTPIFNAYSFETIKDLIDAGADVNVQDKHDHNTILHVQYFQHSIVKLILDSGFDVSLKNRMGWNILHYHTANGHHWLLEDILNAGIDVDDKTHDGQTAIAIANYHGEDECYTILERFNIKKMSNRNDRDHEGLGI